MMLQVALCEQQRAGPQLLTRVSDGGDQKGGGKENRGLAVDFETCLIQEGVGIRSGLQSPGAQGATGAGSGHIPQRRAEV